MAYNANVASAIKCAH